MNNNSNNKSVEEPHQESIFLGKTESEISNFLEKRMIMMRGKKNELAKAVEVFFGKTLDAVYDNVQDEDADNDFQMSLSFSEETPNDTKWCDIELYYLKTRKRNHRYVTEVSFKLY